MAQEVHSYRVIVPAGTLSTAPIVVGLPLPPRIVDEIRVKVPPGPRGEVGFAIGSAGIAVLPPEPGAFIVTDNETVAWPVQDQITSGAWQLQAYNTGQFNHSLYVQLLTRVTTGASADTAGAAPLPVDLISG